jgi:hypothetical protein
VRKEDIGQVWMAGKKRGGGRDAHQQSRSGDMCPRRLSRKWLAHSLLNLRFFPGNVSQFLKCNNRENGPGNRMAGEVA